ncbi:Inosine-5'-monophosphate dehydrogenase 1 [Sesamum angolense]|uniref:Inosine-5'-monophosphate dehydrogenase 1 n=1 Tax=Sesamum angolense TaxID=2727404 RepID=A0AAE2BHV5_9LAMI|nr:Inosine-5'-monophosphate dehydrogenase 1 [Sesamum angolense]
MARVKIFHNLSDSVPGTKLDSGGRGWSESWDGIRFRLYHARSHIVKALTLGAATVMMGSFLAGSSEAPGTYEVVGDTGSLEAMMKGSDARCLGDKAKLKVAQGVVGAVADKVRTGEAQVEGGVHGLVSYEKKSF